jgi:hypothetical protein
MRIHANSMEVAMATTIKINGADRTVDVVKMITVSPTAGVRHSNPRRGGCSRAEDRCDLASRVVSIMVGTPD